LPATTGEQEPEASGEAALGQKALRGSETILVVEDQNEVRALASNILRLNGYRVVEACNAGEALLICEREPGAIHLMLTDVVMPGLNGRELAERVKPLRPGIKVVYMSGYTDDIVIRRGTLEPGTAYIQKPFTPVRLASQIREVLGPGRSGPAVLVVDDDEGIRRMMNQILSAEGYRVIEASDGREAVQRIEEENPSLVIMDLVMPGQDGLESIRMLHVQRPGLKIIAISGAFGGEYLKPAQMLGAVATLPKPIHPEQLTMAVRKALEES
jgi:CheY-like chemotaxis protein